MSTARTFLQSAIGKKVVMAVTGVILVGFVLAHMAGNLQVYLGPEAMNAYAAALRELLHGAGLWIARLVLLAAVGLHVWAATSLTLQSRAARPVGYRRFQAREATYASRTMRWSGVLLALFILFHILHLTTGTVHPSFETHDVYHNFVAGFRSVPVAVVYIVAMVLLGLHLRHGVWSMLQTLGVSHPRYERVAKVAAAAVATVVVVGNVSFPVAVLLGWIE